MRACEQKKRMGFSTASARHTRLHPRHLPYASASGRKLADISIFAPLPASSDILAHCSLVFHTSSSTLFPSSFLNPGSERRRSDASGGRHAVKQVGRAIFDMLPQVSGGFRQVLLEGKGL